MFLQTNFKDKLLRYLLFFLFIFITLILIKKFNKYLNQNDIAKISILVILSSITFFGTLSQKLAKINAILLVYFILILYVTNSLLVYVDYNSSQKKNIEKIVKKNREKFDQRKLIEVVEEERSLGNEIYPYVVPREFLKTNHNSFLPLTPMPNKEFISCNEFGIWKKIKTDKLGFNNQTSLNFFDILLMGDSFAEGSCVNEPFEPTQLFKRHFNKNAYTIGISGNGPFLSLALSHEVKNLLDFEYIVWLIYDNDFYDVEIESKSDYLLKYLEKNFIGNNYFSNLDRSIDYQKTYINKNLSSFKTGYSLKESLLELKALIHKINRVLNPKKATQNFNYSSKHFQKIFDKLYNLYPSKKIFAVYLPETSCFEFRSEECAKRFLHLENSSSKIKFLNFYEFIKNKDIDYIDMYALGQKYSHFSEEGYTELIKFINNKIIENN